MRFNKKVALPALGNDAAKEIISEVLEEDGYSPCAIPMEVLSSYTEYRRDRHALEKSILIVVLVLFLLLPLFFIPPRFEVTELARARTGIPTYEIFVRSFIPVESVSVRSGGKTMSVTEVSGEVFTANCSENGTVVITVTLLNRQYEIWTAELSGIDNKAPKMISSAAVDGHLRIFLSDEGSGVDYANACAYDFNGNVVAPLYYSVEEGYVDFEFLSNMNLFIPDFNGNELQLILTMKK